MWPPSFTCRSSNSRSVVSIAEYIRTGTFTTPNEIAPVQIARGMAPDFGDREE